MDNHAALLDDARALLDDAAQKLAQLRAIRPVIAGRLAEVTGRPAASFPDEVLDWMIRLMRRDLRAGLRLAYDKPVELLDLLRRALAMPAAPTFTAPFETR